MAKKLPLEFTKYDPLPDHLMYVKIEALIPVLSNAHGNNSDEISDSINEAIDALCNYGHGFVTAQYEIKDDICTATEIIRKRRENGDISGEIL